MENYINNIKLYQWQNEDNTELFRIEVHNFKNSLNLNPFIKLSTFIINSFNLPCSKEEVERAINERNEFFKS